MGWKENNEMEGRDVDIRKKVGHAFFCEKVHVTAQFESLCHFVHLKGLPDELNGHEQTHQCTESDLDSVYSFRPDGGTLFRHAKRKIKHLSGKHYVIGRRTSCYVVCIV